MSEGKVEHELSVPVAWSIMSKLHTEASYVHHSCAGIRKGCNIIMQKKNHVLQYLRPVPSAIAFVFCLQVRAATCLLRGFRCYVHLVCIAYYM